jgi:RecB family exonuclease
LLSLDRVAHLFPPPERPPELRQLDQLLDVWSAYERRKNNHLLDRGDLAMAIVDALAACEQLPPRQLVVVGTHGLAQADRMMLHLLDRLGWDMAIGFAPHDAPASSSESDRQWLVAHGWHAVDTPGWREPRTSVIHLPTPREEVRRILAAIKELWAGGLPLAQIAIVVPGGELYQELLLEHHTSGVPMSLVHQEQLSLRPEAIALHVLCQVVADGWQRADVERLALCGAVPMGSAVEMLAKTASLYRIAGGSGAAEWMERVQDNDPVAVAGREGIRQLAAACDFVPANGMAEAAMSGLKQAARILGIDVPSTVAATMDAYANSASRLSLPPASIRTQAARWWQVVRSAGQTTEVPPADSVFVGAANEVRLSQYSVVFAPGMVDGLLPVLRRDVIDETLLGRTALQLEMERWADVRAAASDGRLVVTVPQLLKDQPTLTSQFLLETHAEDAGIEALSSSAHVLLDVRDLRAFVEGVHLDTSTTQHGMQMDVLPEAARDAVLRTMDAPLSPTRLDRAMACPYQHYVRDHLRLGTTDEGDEAITPLERGLLLHAVAHRFFQEVRGVQEIDVRTLQDLTRSQADLTTQPLEYWMPLLLQCYHAERASIPSGYLYSGAEERLLLDNTERPGLLRRWLAMEYELQQTAPWRPALFELSFDGTLNLGFGMEHVALRIDRVDVDLTSPEAQAVVIDYKTTSGSLPVKRQVMEGSRTQPPLYMLAAQAWFDERQLPVSVVEMRYHTFGRELRSLKEPASKSALPIQQKGEEKGSTVMIGAMHVLQGAQAGVSVLRSGPFDVRPSADACANCDLGELCRVAGWGESILIH